MLELICRFGFITVCIKLQLQKIIQTNNYYKGSTMLLGLNMKKLVYIVVVLCLTSCFATTPAKSPSELENVVFIDTNVFDKDLADSMSVKTDTITVVPVGHLSINQMPERLSKWLGAISDKKGQVEIEPKVEGTRSLGLLISLLPLALQYLRNESSYGLAGNYNATINYEPETGVVKKIVFNKKL